MSTEHQVVPPDVWVVRHGATEWSEEGRHTGRTDVALADDGRRQAASLFRPLDRQRFSLVLTSPLDRARETARLAGFADAVVDDALLEWDYGEYEGLTTPRIRERAPGWTIWNGAVPGGEKAEEVGARAARVLVRCGAAGGRVLLFGHAHALRVLTAVALGFGPRDGARFALDPASFGVIGHEHEYRTLRSWNVPGS